LFKRARLVSFVDATRTLGRKRKRRRRTLVILIDQMTGIASYMSTESILTKISAMRTVTNAYLLSHPHTNLSGAAPSVTTLIRISISSVRTVANKKSLN
jgi:hypothetical protein